VRKVLKEPQVLRGLPDHRVVKEQLVLPEPREIKEKQVSREIRERVELQEIKVQ